ncbi:hypothetical protein [Halpernia sp.]|uniref:hypothetical protein n=1 Tax=Halpernia sp. TaxID=2782209 RepID=UPI003A8F2C83
MKITFKIEFKYENGFILGRLLNLKEHLELKVNSKLNIFDIENITNPKSLQTENKKRADLFIFSLKNNLSFEKLCVGKIVEIV